MTAASGWSIRTTSSVGSSSRSDDRPRAPARDDVGVQVFGHEHGIGLGERRHPPQLVHQLPHVPRPRVEHEVLQRLVGETEAALAEIAREALEEYLDQLRNLLAALAQGRDVEPHVQPEEQVFAEAPLADELAQVVVGGGDDADVGAHRVRLAERLHFAGFEESQQLRLQVPADFADFVEEHRAAFGRSDHAGERVVGARVRAAPMAEQLVFEHFGGHGRAVERDERLARAARLVNDARHHLLADAGFAGDQEVDRRDGVAARSPEQLLHLL